MKRIAHRFLARLWLTAALALLPGCATTSVPEEPGTLKVLVNVPPSWNILLDDRIAEVFVDHVREVFHREGFDRPVEEIRLVEEPQKAPYLLTINLTEWRINRIGNIDCTFTAELKTPRGTKTLGLYTHTTMRWLGGIGRWGLVRSFEEAAEGAIKELCDDVAQSELLPSFRKGELYSGAPRRDGRSA